MHLSDGDSELLKTWLVQQVETITDADADVLADYVLALVRSDEPDDQVKQNCLTNLEDFLAQQTAPFVDNVFNAIKTRAFDPSKPTTLTASAPAFVPQGPAAGFKAPPNAPSQPSLKRSAQDDFDGQDGQFQRGGGGGGRGDRPMKQLRRGGRGYDQRGGGRGGARPQYQRPQDFAQQQQQVPQLDPNNPLASLLAMQAMGMTLPGMPQFPMPDMGQQMSGRSGERCLDYDTKGFCALGASCPYEHGNDPVVVPNRAEEYDPANAGLAQNGRSASPRHAGFAERGRGRGRGRGDRGAARGGRGGRAAFSSAGPNHDKSITSVVVEQIPEEKFDEQSIRDFFSDFGTIEDLTLQSYKRLAVVQYADYDSAKRAYDSPKVVFDNRFVKVYWYKPDTLPKPPGGGPRPQRNGENGKSTDGDVEMTEEEEKMDPVEFAKKQEEAQRVHEERMKKVQEAQTARQELEQKLKAQAEERSKLLAKLAEKERAKTATPAAPSTGDGQANGSEATLNGKSNGQTEALRKKLAELESEAVSMGINPEEASAPNGFPARGRGGFRGNSRGAWNPRGAWRGGRGGGGGYNPRGGSVMRLDNRPKTVAVVFPSGKEMDAETDEALKQYLLFGDLMESATLSSHPERKDAAIVSFTERYKAEMFLAGANAKEIPHIGKVEALWVQNAQQTPATTSTQGAGGAFGGNGESVGVAADVKMDEDARVQEGERGDMDYDVADDDERWLVG